jgi:hypothetical protein
VASLAEEIAGKGHVTNEGSPAQIVAARGALNN